MSSVRYTLCSKFRVFRDGAMIREIEMNSDMAPQEYTRHLKENEGFEGNIFTVKSPFIRVKKLPSI